MIMFIIISHREFPLLFKIIISGIIPGIIPYTTSDIICITSDDCCLFDELLQWSTCGELETNSFTVCGVYKMR